MSVQTEIEFAEKIRDGIFKKANINKKWATFLFGIIILATVLSPTLILVSNNDIISKYTPAGLTVLAAISAYWIQVRKPNERWVLYRTYQREIEHEINSYKFATGKYKDAQEKEKLLAESINDKALKLHYDWIPMVPKATELEELLPTPKTLSDGN